MAHVHDVASYILNKKGPMTTMKLQKLVYYSQAWSLVWDEKPLFLEKIEAWASGPVVPDLFQRHRRVYMVDEWPWGEHEKLTLVEKASIDAVLDYYGNKSSQWLSDLTHMESPWKKARNGLGSFERGNKEITHESMMEYYSSLPPADHD